VDSELVELVLLYNVINIFLGKYFLRRPSTDVPFPKLARGMDLAAADLFRIFNDISFARLTATYKRNFSAARSDMPPYNRQS